MIDFNIEEKSMLINLAMQIESGAIEYKKILNCIKEDPEEWSRILLFWMRFNDMTKRVVDLLCLEKSYMNS